MKGWQIVGFLSSFAAVAIAAARYQSEPLLPNPTVPQLESGQPYAVHVEDGLATVDIQAGGESEYTLIVSSLGDSGGEFAVELQSETLAAVKSTRGRRVRPLTNRRKSASLPGNWEPRHMRVTPSRTRAHESKPARALRTFFLHVTEGSLDDPRQYARVESRLIRSGRQVRVYLDAQQTERELCPGAVDEIVRLFDDEIMPTSQKWLGERCDVDGDGTFLILLSPWLSRLQGGRVSLGGFVRGSDFRESVAPPFGNRCDMMCLNSNVTPGRNLKALLSHEFAHAIAFSARLRSRWRPYDLPDEEDWMNEAIAHLSENLHDAGWSNLDHRIRDYLDAPQSFPLVVPDYYSAGLWRNHGCRGATYLFLRWCVDQFGPRILAELINSPATGRNNIARVTGLSFEELYRRWSIAISGATEFDGYEHIALHGRLGRQQLSGPRNIVWNAAETSSETLVLRGTATAFVKLGPATTDVCRRIRITAPPEARLQVTVIKSRTSSRPRRRDDQLDRLATKQASSRLR